LAFICFHQTFALRRCYLDNGLMLLYLADDEPETPKDFQLVELGSTFAIFSWQMSEFSSDLTYRLHYSIVMPSGEHGRDIIVEVGAV
jgi:hypothetical protein